MLRPDSFSMNEATPLRKFEGNDEVKQYQKVLKSNKFIHFI
jgi:hypothetical protein